MLETQDASGAFGAWGPSNGDMWLTAFVTDFLTRAKEAGYTVRQQPYNQALDRLANFIGYAQDFEKGGEDRAYALYVLARNGRAPIGEPGPFGDPRPAVPVAARWATSAIATTPANDAASGRAIDRAARMRSTTATVTRAGTAGTVYSTGKKLPPVAFAARNVTTARANTGTSGCRRNHCRVDASAPTATNASAPNTTSTGHARA